MDQLQQAAKRERRAPIFWWLIVMAATGGALVWMVYDHSRPVAGFLAVLLAAAWAAPLVALQSLAAPPRAKRPAPEPGEGTYDDWKRQALLLGRVLLYFGDNPNLSPEVHRSLHEARADLRDTLNAHPLRDDLERVCRRVRAGAIRDMKDWLSREYRHDIRVLANEYEQAAAGMDADQRLLALQRAVGKAAAMMSRNCMPRMLERQRLICATDCAWLAVQAAVERPGQVSPVDLAEMLVIEWIDFSEPWQPARALRLALDRLARRPDAPDPVPAPDGADGRVVIRNGKRYRRVRVRHKHRRHSHRSRGPSLVDVFLSFGQWLRYSIRAWLLYR